MAYRGHEPISIDSFNGLWQQGDAEDVPNDHFSDCENVQFLDASSVSTRYGIGPHQTVALPLQNVVRLYNYITTDANTLLALTWDGTTGNLYHVVEPGTNPFLILTLVGMEDFGFAPYGGRAYITPFRTYTFGTIRQERGLQNEFLYVYDGLGNPARRAGIVAPTGTLTVANGIAGNTDPGDHLFAVVFETSSGALSAPGAFSAVFETDAAFSVSFSNIPVSPNPAVIARHIVATKIIEDFNGNTTGYTYYFIPNATISDNVTTTLPNISFFDADLLEDASHLLDDFGEIPAGVNLFLYHNRMCLCTPYDNISVVYVSANGEPEAFNQIDGLLEIPPDGNPITTGAELRDVLYIMKRNRTVSFTDNDDIPATWPMTMVDQAYGSPVHGLGTVIDSGSANVDYLIVATARGLVVFNGRYALPELTWKIDDFWLTQDKNEFRRIQVVTDTINQIIYTTLPDRRLLIGNYSNGLDPQAIRWAPWRFAININTIALVNINELILGAEINAS